MKAANPNNTHDAVATEKPNMATAGNRLSSASMAVTAVSQLLFVIVTLTMVSPCSAGLRDGFSSQVGSDSRSRMKLDDAGAAGGMSREMFLMKDKQWEIHPIDFSSVKNGKLRRHCEAYLNRPVKMKLSTRQGKHGFRAQGETTQGNNLRGFWRQRDGSSALGTDLLKVSYDDAVKQRLPTVEFEVLLPPLSSSKKGGKKKAVSVIYTVAVEPGAMNQKAMVPRGSGSVKILPQGHGDGSEVETLTLPAKAYVSIPMGPGLVDRGWAKGNVIFRKGRPTGPV